MELRNRPEMRRASSTRRGELGAVKKRRTSRPPKLEKMALYHFDSFLFLSLSKRHMGRTDVAHCVIFIGPVF